MGSVEAGKNSFHFRVALRPRGKAINFPGGLLEVAEGEPTFRGFDMQEVIDVQQSSPSVERRIHAGDVIKTAAIPYGVFTCLERGPGVGSRSSSRAGGQSIGGNPPFEILCA